METLRYPPLGLASVLVCSILGCATGPSFEDYLQELRISAGANGEECGVVVYGEPRDDALSCGHVALDEGRPFWVVIQVQGIDSQIFLGLAVNDRGRDWAIDWSSGGAGFSSRFITRRFVYKRTCDAPVLADVPGEGLTLCGRN